MQVRNKAKDDEEAKKADARAAQNQPNLLANNLQNPVVVPSVGSPINAGGSLAGHSGAPDLNGCNLMFFVDGKLDKLFRDGAKADDFLLSSQEADMMPSPRGVYGVQEVSLGDYSRSNDGVQEKPFTGEVVPLPALLELGNIAMK